MESARHLNTNQQRVLQCIVDLANAGRPAARALVAQQLGLKFAAVDEAVKWLKEEGLVRAVVPGIFAPVAQFPQDRPLSATVLPDGRWKIEVGDDVLTLNPHEVQVMGKMLQGPAQELSYWMEERRTGEQVVRLEALARSQQKQILELQRSIARTFRPGRGQPDLFTEPGEAPLGRRRGPHLPVATGS